MVLAGPGGQGELSGWTPSLQLEESLEGAGGWRMGHCWVCSSQTLLKQETEPGTTQQTVDCRTTESEKNKTPESVSSVPHLCLTLCNPMYCSTPGFSVHHQLPKLAQTHVHRVGDAIQPSHPLSSPSPPAPHPSQHQGLFQ